MDSTTQDNRPVYQEPFPTPFGTTIVARVYPLEGTYTIKDSQGRDIREENMPIAHMQHLKIIRENIETWAKEKIAQYNAKISAINQNPTTAPPADTGSTDSNSGTNTDTSGTTNP